MRIKVIKPLNTHIGGPYTTFQKGVVRVPGEEIEVNAKVQGEEIDNNNNWYQQGDTNNQYYWSGGVNEISQLPVNNNGISPMTNYNQLIQSIPDEWRTTYGNGVTVAILDAGFNINHVDLANSIIGTYNAVDKTNDVSPDSVIEDHGSNIAGIIASNSQLANGIIGIASAAKLVLIKVSANGHITANSVLNGLDYALNTANVDIINLSLLLDDDEYNPLQKDFLNLFAIADEKKTLIIASAGENSGLLSTETELQLPANEDYCLSIGTINGKFLQNNPTPQFNNRLNYLIPYMQLMSCAGQGNTYSSIDNSSMAAAVLTGVCALLRSYLATRVEREDFIDKFETPLSSFNSTVSLTQLSIYKI